MTFTDKISFVMDKAPAGWKQRLSLFGYDKLDNERKQYYGPVYARYRTKKVRDYDFDTGQFCGWKPVQVGIGVPIGYKYVGYFVAREIDQINRSNILMRRVLS